MRAKVIISVGLLAAAVVVPAVYFHAKSDSAAPTVPLTAADSAVTTEQPAAPAVSRIVVRGIQRQAQGIAPAEAQGADPKAAEHEAYVADRKADFYQLGLSQDSGSLPTVLSGMRDPDPSVRQAALTAAMDLGDKSAIPALRNELAATTNPDERQQIQDAIDYLDLPAYSQNDPNGINLGGSGN